MSTEQLKSKQCSDCREVKGIEAFKPNTYKSDGVDRYCKECRKTREVHYKDIRVALYE